MTQEEKAKAYDEALERAKKLYNSEETSADVEIACETIFPELAESEDEKVKRIIHSISNKISFHLHDIFTEEEFQCFDAWSNAWLEKQNPVKVNEKDERISKDIAWCIKHSGIENHKPINRHVTTTVKEALAWLEKQGTSYTKRDVDDAYLKGVIDTKNEIEKQYEANYQTRKDIATFIFNYRGDIKDRAKWMDYLGIKVSFVGEQGEQKPIANVKPKFKVGDFIANDYCFGKVIEITNDAYLLDTGQGIPFSCEHNAHLWTINDAKEEKVDNANKVEPKFKVKYAGNEYNVFETKDIAGVTFYGIEDEPNHIDYVKAENCEIISVYAIKEKGSPYPTKPAVFSEKKPKRMISAEAKEAMYDKPACVGRNDTLLDLLNKMPSCITVDGIDYHFVMKKTITFMAFYEGEGEEGRDKIIFWMAGEPIELLTAMLNKLKEEGLLE